MIRKQFYIAPEQQRKLHALAKRWGCTEAEVVRKALDRLADPTGSLDDRLREAGLLVESEEEVEVPSSREVAELENRFEGWFRSRTEPLGLSQAVFEDRS